MAYAMPARTIETPKIFKSRITPRNQKMERLRAPNLDAQSDLIVIRSLYSILLATQTSGTKVQRLLTNGWRGQASPKIAPCWRYPLQLGSGRGRETGSRVCDFPARR